MSPRKEAKRMTNKQLAAMLEALKKIIEQAKDKEEIKKALEAIQSQLTR